MGQQQSILRNEIQHIHFHPQNISYINRLIQRKVSQSTSKKNSHHIPKTRLSLETARKKKLIFTQTFLPSKLPQNSLINQNDGIEKINTQRKKTQSLNLIKYTSNLSQSIFQDEIQNKNLKIYHKNDDSTRNVLSLQNNLFNSNPKRNKRPYDKQNFNPNQKGSQFKSLSYEELQFQFLCQKNKSKQKNIPLILTTDRLNLGRKNIFTQNLRDSSTTNKKQEKSGTQVKKISENLSYEKRKRSQNKSQKIEKATIIQSEMRKKRRFELVQKVNMKLMDLTNVNMLQSLKF